MKKNNKVKWILFIFLIAIIGSIAFLSVSWYANRYVRLRLQEEFSKQTNHQYALSINALRLNLLSRTIKFKGVKIQPDKLPSGEAEYRAAAKKIDFTGLNVTQFIFRKTIIIDGISMLEPSITISQGAAKTSTRDTTAQAFSLYNLVSSFTKSITIKNANITNFDLKIFNSANDLNPAIHSTDNRFRLVNLHVGPSTQHMPGLFSADSVEMVVNNFSYVTSDSLYTMKVGRLQVSYSDSLLWIDSLKVIPNFNKRKFADKAGNQTDRFDIFTKQVSLNSIDLRRFFGYHSVIAEKINISGFSMLAHRNKNYPRAFALPESVQRIVRELPGYVNVDTISVINSEVFYEEIAPGKELAGSIAFTNISANFTGVTNDSLLIATGSNIVFHARSNFMNSGKIVVTYKFPLSTTQMVFDCSGTITDMSLSDFNRMVAPTTGFTLSAGNLDTLNFNFKANDNFSKGSMRFLYSDLKIDNADDTNSSLKDKLIVLAANNLILKKSNPSGNKPAREADMFYKRNKQRFMFHYTWQTILSGIKETVGVPDLEKR